MSRVQVDIRGLSYTFPVNPIEFQWQESDQNFADQTLGLSVTLHSPWYDSRLRVMTWRNLPNKYPYTQLISGLRETIGISGIRLKVRDLDYLGDRDEWVEIFGEDLRISYRKGQGPSVATNALAYDIDYIYSFR